MKYRIEGNELIIKRLFSEKRYNFRELTKLSLVNGISIYQKEKCILKERKDMYAMDFYHLAVKNNLIFEDREWFDEEITIRDVASYSMFVQGKIKEEYYDYVKQELGNEYELKISTDISPYHVILYVNVYCDGQKMCTEDDVELIWSNGKSDINLHYFELVMPTYIDERKMEFRLTKLVDLQHEMEEIKYQINRMKQETIVTVSSWLKDNLKSFFI